MEMAWYWILLEAIVKIGLLVVAFVMGLAAFLTWQERKQSSLMQDRVGPERASIKLPLYGHIRLKGIVHFVADAIKMIAKEDFMPAGASKFLFQLAPIMAFFPALVLFAVVPFGDTLLIFQQVSEATGKVVYYGIPLQISNINAALIFVFAFGSLGMYGYVLSGYASDSKPAMLGGMRATAQMFSYEVCIGLTVVGIMMIYATTNLGVIARAQDGLLFGFLPAWGVFLQPLGFLLFFVAGIMETKRAPFDAPEGESEIIGYFTEYSGMKFGLFMFGEYVEIIFLGALATTLFFGSYYIPWVSYQADVLPMIYTFLGWFGFERPENLLLFNWVNVPSLFLALIQFTVFAVKVYIFCWLQLAIRWTVPRYRYDQIMKVGWKILLPASILNIFITGILVLVWDAF